MMALTRSWYFVAVATSRELVSWSATTYTCPISDAAVLPGVAVADPPAPPELRLPVELVDPPNPLLPKGLLPPPPPPPNPPPPPPPPNPPPPLRPLLFPLPPMVDPKLLPPTLLLDVLERLVLDPLVVPPNKAFSVDCMSTAWPFFTE